MTDVTKQCMSKQNVHSDYLKRLFEYRLFSNYMPGEAKLSSFILTKEDTDMRISCLLFKPGIKKDVTKCEIILLCSSFLNKVTFIKIFIYLNMWKYQVLNELIYSLKFLQF